MTDIVRLQNLLDWAGADEPRSLNRRIYKDTDCGAAISVCIVDPRLQTGPMGEDWLHNGDPRWERVRPGAPLYAVQLSAIVEGLDDGIAAPMRYAPINPADLDADLRYLNDEAARLWEAYNCDCCADEGISVEAEMELDQAQRDEDRDWEFDQFHNLHEED